MQTYIPFSLWDEVKKAAIVEKTAITVRLHCVFLIFFFSTQYFIQANVIERLFRDNLFILVALCGSLSLLVEYNLTGKVFN